MGMIEDARDQLWRIVKDLWRRGGTGRIVAVAMILVVIVAVGETAQNGLLGEFAHRVAVRLVPWRPIFIPRAALSASFWIRRPGGELFTPLVTDSECKVGSRIKVSFSRSRTGWVSVFGLTDDSEYPIDDSGIKAGFFEGGVEYSWEFEIVTADGRESVVVVGADRRFDPRKRIISEFRDINGHKGGAPVLDGYSVRWSDKPEVATCYSIE